MSEQVPLYVRLPAETAQRLDQAATTQGRSKRHLVEQAVREHLVVGRAALQETPPEILTLEEAAALLRIDPSDLQQAAVAGQLPGRLLGQEWRFSREALLAWLANT
ncbi:MAG: helix-turn-helix domain-containing protein [Solirubrobacterales bacterium]|nr:helix-turn-helix domain-containing protein [Solirubrobacterales bacterium]